ncbi:MAG: PASTA domain-containing protein, partial [Actinobacteria bacterium]|nr:PASTA domain-containing protein [Actinomycetota bacterium]
RNADEPEGQVIAQDPAAGAAGVLRGATITLTVSNGAGSLTVPSVLGLTEDAARSRLTSVGLNPDVVQQDTDAQADDGRVLDQAPSSGTRAHSGDSVTIVVGHFVEPTTSTTTTSTTSSTTSTTTTTTP